MRTSAGQRVTDRSAVAGYVIGGVYFSREAGQRYVVEGVTTLWECAPAEAVVIRWENGNRTVRASGPTGDALVGVPPARSRGVAVLGGRVAS